MKILRNDENGKITLSLEGWLDNTGAPELGAVVEAIEAVKELVLDFAGVEYLSSAGIRQVLQAHRKAKAQEGSLRIIHVNPDVMNIFKMTGLSDKLSISEKEE